MGFGCPRKQNGKRQPEEDWTAKGFPGAARYRGVRRIISVIHQVSTTTLPPHVVIVRQARIQTPQSRTQVRWVLSSRTIMVCLIWRETCRNGVGIGLERRMHSLRQIIQPAHQLGPPESCAAATGIISPVRPGAPIEMPLPPIPATTLLVFAACEGINHGVPRRLAGNP